MNIVLRVFGLLTILVSDARAGTLLSPGNSPRVCPVDTVVTAGETVHLRCTAHPDDMVRWHRGNESNPGALCIYSGEEFFEDTVDVDRFSVRDDLSTGASELFITNARPEDVGVYMCTGIPSNARAIVKLDVVEPIIDLTSSKNISSRKISRKCRFRYYGPIKPTAEWLDMQENRLPSSSEESAETVGLVSTSTNDPSAAQCRLSFHLSSCGHPDSRVDFRLDERNLKVAPDDEQSHAPTAMPMVKVIGGTDILMQVWAWSASSAAVLFALSTLVMCCVKRRRRPATICTHYGGTNKVLRGSHATLSDSDKSLKPKCLRERGSRKYKTMVQHYQRTLSVHVYPPVMDDAIITNRHAMLCEDGDELESAYEGTQSISDTYEDLKFDFYTKLVVESTDDK